MSSLNPLVASAVPSARYQQVDQKKSTGATYTPATFARFVAEQIIGVAQLPALGKIRMLDPAVGDGALLDALITALPESLQKRIEAVGYDSDPIAINVARQRLGEKFPNLDFQLECKDFLEHVLSLEISGDLFAVRNAQEPFHLVIANPPYVRTQVLGALQAQQLAQRFGLTGRVDLYYPFLIGISQVLAKGGVMGVITSNRFMTTRSGQAVRRAMMSRFGIVRAFDLGDTKLFDAAVLPSVIIACGIDAQLRPEMSGIGFSSIYEAEGHPDSSANDVLDALSKDDNNIVAIPDGRLFRVRHGILDNGGDIEGTWRVATKSVDRWLATVESNTWDTFRRVGKIRVGVKSTADKVFVRSDWNDLEDGRPELLRPLITRHCARQFRAVVPARAKYLKEILYPHIATDEGREAVDLDHYPKAKRYLERHRDILEARSYVIEAGRQWYELWVPHDPAAWSFPKLVFPDISEKPVFWIDTTGGVVSGECYWLRCQRPEDEDLLWLALAVANSTFIEAFYDHRFNNKLYAGRRRFITQYVEQFPLPDPTRGAVKLIVELAKVIYAKVPSDDADRLIASLDEQVWSVFGLAREKILR